MIWQRTWLIRAKRLGDLRLEGLPSWSDILRAAMRGSFRRLASHTRQCLTDNNPSTPLSSAFLNTHSSIASEASASGTHRGYASGRQVTATLFPGDGIGPEIAESVKHIFKALNVPIDWDEQHIGQKADPRTNSMVTRENLDSVLVSCSWAYWKKPPAIIWIIVCCTSLQYNFLPMILLSTRSLLQAYTSIFHFLSLVLLFL